MPDSIHIPETAFPGQSPHGIEMKVLLQGSETDGTVSLFEEITHPNAGPPLHVHYNSDEFFRILDGQYRFQAGDRVIDATPGDSVYVPKGTPHCFCNVGEKAARMFMGFTPAGAEEFFDWLEANGMPSGDAEETAMLRDRYAIAFLGPNPFAR